MWAAGRGLYETLTGERCRGLKPGNRASTLRSQVPAWLRCWRNPVAARSVSFGSSQTDEHGDGGNSEGGPSTWTPLQSRHSLAVGQRHSRSVTEGKGESDVRRLRSTDSRPQGTTNRSAIRPMAPYARQVMTDSTYVSAPSTGWRKDSARDFPAHSVRQCRERALDGNIPVDCTWRRDGRSAGLAQRTHFWLLEGSRTSHDTWPGPSK